MSRIALAVLFLVQGIMALGQSAPASDPKAITLAGKSLAALTGGNPVLDATLKASVIFIVGSDYENGTAILRAKGAGESRVDLNLSTKTRTDVRNMVNGFPAGAWSQNGAKPAAYVQHNCWTDAVWFFPALSSLSQTSNPGFVFRYVGEEQHNGLVTQHIRVRQARSGLPAIHNLSTMDFYLDPTSFLPLSIAFNSHTDTDVQTKVPVEINFADYRQVRGTLVPFHLQWMLNGGVILDITVTNATLNTGLPDSSFTLQ